jgi:lysophospholipase L1-like esterase
MNHKKKLGFAVVVFLFSTCASLIVLEVAVRIRQWLRFGTTDAKVVSLKIDESTGLRILVPNSETKTIRVNSLGFRGPEIEDPKPEGRIRIAYLGGSTTFCAEVSGEETTWPHLVWQKLQAAYPKSRFDYLNAGVPGYGLGEVLRSLEQRVQNFKPDIIIVYEATNDISYDTRELARKQGIYQGDADDPSWLAKRSVAWYLIEKNLQIYARQKGALSNDTRLVFEPSSLARGFRQRLTQLVQTSKKVAPIVAVATFSTKFRRTQSKEEQLQAANTSLYYMPYMSVSGLLDAFEEYNAVVRQVAKETGVVLIDGENEIPGDDLHFNDSVHFKDEGSRIMAHRVATALIGSGKLQSLMITSDVSLR